MSPSIEVARSGVPVMLGGHFCGQAFIHLYLQSSASFSEFCLEHPLIKLEGDCLLLQQLHNDSTPLLRWIANLSCLLALTNVGVSLPAWADLAPPLPPNNNGSAPVNSPPPLPPLFNRPDRPALGSPPDLRLAPPPVRPIGPPPNPLALPQNSLPNSTFQNNLPINSFEPRDLSYRKILNQENPNRKIPNREISNRVTQWTLLDTIVLQPWQPVTIAEMEAIASPLPAPSRATAQLAQNPGNDPELGEIRLKPNTDPELGTLTLRPISASDPELGDLRIREPRPLPAPPPPKAPSVFLLGRVDYFRNTNIFSSAFLQESDGLIRSGLTLFYAPALGPQTYAVTSIDANVIRYANASLLNYDELRFRAGILQRLSPRMFGEIGWSNQQLFTAKEGLRNVLTGERFLNDNSLRIEFSRQDPLTRQLSFNTYYQFRWSLVDEIKDYDRLINTFVSSLSYQLSPSLQAALDYQFIWTHFTQQSREDWYHQLAGRLSYTLNPRTQINIFGGRSFGNSSNPGLNFNGWLLGVGVVFNVPLF